MEFECKECGKMVSTSEKHTFTDCQAYKRVKSVP